MTETSTADVRLVNTTPHMIRLRTRDGRYIELDAVSGHAARVALDAGRPRGVLNGVPLFGPARFHRIIHLPPSRAGDVFVVSKITAMICAAVHPERTDLVFPGEWEPAVGKPRFLGGNRNGAAVTLISAT